MTYNIQMMMENIMNRNLLLVNSLLLIIVYTLIRYAKQHLWNTTQAYTILIVIIQYIFQKPKTCLQRVIFFFTWFIVAGSDILRVNYMGYQTICQCKI